MKVCFIGLGSIGTRHCENLAAICTEENIELTIHALRSTQKPLKESLRQLDICLLRSVEEMDKDYDAIFITNPTSLHYQILAQIGDRSRCFFIEKPVFEQPDEDISALPLSRDAICYVAAPLRYTHVLQEAKRYVDSHRIFCARAISSSYLPDWRPGTDYRNTYSAHKEMGGGVSIDLIHEWDYLSMLFGFPQRVFNVIGKYSELELDSDDLAIYIASYPDKAVELHLDYFGKETRRSLELFTAEGTAIFDIANACIRSTEGSTVYFEERPNDKYIAEMRYFLSLVSGAEKENQNSIRHATDVLRLARGE